MPTKTLTQPWLDRFEQPSVDALMEAIDPELLPLAQRIFDGFCRVEGTSTQPRWEGLPWRWTIAFFNEHVDADRAIAFLIPEPNAPRVAVPLDREEAPTLLTTKSAKCLRENLAQSSRVGDVVWSEWQLNTRVLADELVKLVRTRSAARRKA